VSRLTIRWYDFEPNKNVINTIPTPMDGVWIGRFGAPRHVESGKKDLLGSDYGGGNVIKSHGHLPESAQPSLARVLPRQRACYTV
jgi:hypothetical protein